MTETEQWIAGTAAGELVVLLDDDGQRVGTAEKEGVHDANTPLHLAFSCYVFDPAGKLLITRRALGKRSWPGVWTNSCCGHPRPDEPPEEAVHRHLRSELGITVAHMRLRLPSFRYRAVDPNGTVEHEICPVYTAVSNDAVHPDPAEVAEHRWVDWEDLVAVAELAPWAISPWSAKQVSELAHLLADE